MCERPTVSRPDAFEWSRSTVWLMSWPAASTAPGSIRVFEWPRLWPACVEQYQVSWPLRLGKPAKRSMHTQRSSNSYMCRQGEAILYILSLMLHGSEDVPFRQQN